MFHSDAVPVFLPPTACNPSRLGPFSKNPPLSDCTPFTRLITSMVTERTSLDSASPILLSGFFEASSSLKALEAMRRSPLFRGRFPLIPLR